MQDSTATKEPSLLLLSKLRGLETNKALDYYLPLLLLAHRLSLVSKIDMSVEQLREDMLNEILSINATLLNLKIYDEVDITRLRYCVCVFIDESLMKNEIFIDSYWANNPLTIRLFNENQGGDKFFGVMDKWLENPSKNKDTLEFIYVCLILGYRGKFDIEPDCKEKILYLCDNICSAITPSMESKEDIFNQSSKVAHKADLLAMLSTRAVRHTKMLFLLAPLLLILIAFSYSLWKVNENNKIIESMLIESLEDKGL
ncbi:DotU family type IV/VI secretion system protein [Helicobacter didelphidarum]|uniref:DotU family type IV/VI secretion system protein n=1 Tax=Helicobacter didelphidarum TaxID=2040648 RepID=A0A3D8ICK8_9HELI|nr:type IVB secretion system protein IcmH/DotU [Helicobacter didelphidarum]RDU62933.1 DotU family type IV/VI secretion system protein [Helicobacter didelphidarum]